jgi:hypothetical protein
MHLQPGIAVYDYAKGTKASPACVSKIGDKDKNRGNDQQKQQQIQPWGNDGRTENGGLYLHGFVTHSASTLSADWLVKSYTFPAKKVLGWYPFLLFWACWQGFCPGLHRLSLHKVYRVALIGGDLIGRK